MRRSLHTFLPVSGDAEAIRHAFTSDPDVWLPDGEPVDDDRWTTTVRAGHLVRTVTARVGPPRRAGDTRWRSLSWEPSAPDDGHGPIERFLPSLDGQLGLNVTLGDATLLLDASYEPPGGLAGAALDSVALHQVARHTLERFLADIATRLGGGVAPATNELGEHLRR